MKNQHHVLQQNEIKHIIYYVLVAVLFLCSTHTSLAQSPFNTNEHIKSFAAHLYSSKDYLRASLEYKSLSLNEIDDTVRYRLGYCSLKLDDSVELHKHLKSIQSGNLNFSLKEQVMKNYFSGDLFSQLIGFDTTFNKISDFTNLVQVSKVLSGSETSIDVFTNSIKPGDADDSLSYLTVNYLAPERKSLTLAACMSAIIPGAGKIYTGKTGDGVTAFIFTGLSAFLAYDNFTHKHNLRGYIFTVTGSLFYLGNIYGSAASAQIKNCEIKETAAERLKEYVRLKNYYLNSKSEFPGLSR